MFFCMPGRTKKSEHGPERHTILINDVRRMWEKLYWDVGVLTDIQLSYPDRNDEQPLVYASLNACISSWSLNEWALGEFKRQNNEETRKVLEARFKEIVTATVPMRDMCNAIANTTKHANYKHGNWVNGELTLEFAEGDARSPPSLYIRASDGNSATPFFKAIGALPKCWWSALLELKLVDGAQPTPVWLQRKNVKMFGGTGKSF
jgi:hypothetical protein